MTRPLFAVSRTQVRRCPRSAAVEAQTFVALPFTLRIHPAAARPFHSESENAMQEVGVREAVCRAAVTNSSLFAISGLGFASRKYGMPSEERRESLCAHIHQAPVFTVDAFG